MGYGWDGDRDEFRVFTTSFVFSSFHSFTSLRMLCAMICGTGLPASRMWSSPLRLTCCSDYLLHQRETPQQNSGNSSVPTTCHELVSGRGLIVTTVCPSAAMRV
jgi:hypothetical protein